MSLQTTLHCRKQRLIISFQRPEKCFSSLKLASTHLDWPSESRTPQACGIFKFAKKVAGRKPAVPARLHEKLNCGLRQLTCVLHKIIYSVEQHSSFPRQQWRTTSHPFQNRIPSVCVHHKVDPMAEAGKYSVYPNSPPGYPPYGSPNYASRKWAQSPSSSTFHEDFSPSLVGPHSGGQPNKQFIEPLIREYEPSFHRPTRIPDRLAIFLYNWWLCIISIVTSILALAAIVILLAVVDNRTLPKLPLSITVNTYISFFATIAKATMLFAVAESLSQLKWLWFRQPRMLDEIQTFDDASRGPMGAVKLIIQTSAFHLATLGSLITILSLVMDPFAQQILSYPERIVQVGTARVTRAQAYNEQVDLSTCKLISAWLAHRYSPIHY